MQEKQAKEQHELKVGNKIKHKYSGEVGIISLIKKNKLFINYSSYSCNGKSFGVRFRWVHKESVIREVDNEDR